MANGGAAGIKLYSELASETYTDPSKPQVRPQRYGLGIYLFLLFITLSYFAIASLGAHHFQHSVRDVGLANGQSLSVSGLLTYRKKNQEIEGRYRSERDRLLGLRAQVNSDETPTDVTTDFEDIPLFLRIQDDIEKLSSISAETQYLESRVDAQKLLADGAETLSADELQNLVSTLNNMSSERDAVAQSLYTKACDLLREVVINENTYHRRRSDLLLESGFGTVIKNDPSIDANTLLGPFTILLYQIETREPDVTPCSYPNLLSSSSSPKFNAALVEPLNEFDFFNPSTDGASGMGSGFLPWNWPDYIFSFLIHLPVQMLTMVLVIAMGGLGSAIDLLRRFLDKSIAPRLDFYVFMPLLGAITGLAVFVLFKSGIVLMIEPNIATADTILNPYFIAILGLISGLLAKEAIDMILKVGRRFLNNAETMDRPRWFVGDAELANDTDGIVAKLSERLDVRKEVVVDWLSARRSVPGSAQHVISDRLDTPRHAIFTDLDPGRKLPIEDTADPTVTDAIPEPAG